jgi:integrase
MLDTTAAPGNPGANDPAITPRRDPETITVRALVDHLAIANGWGTDQTKNFRSRAKAFCASRGLGLDDPARRVISHSFNVDRSKVIDDLAIAGKVSKNVAWAADTLHEALNQLAADAALPVDFADALAYAMKRSGYTPTRLIRELDERYGTEHHGSIYEYLRGSRHPNGKKGRDMVTRIEFALGLQAGSLLTRAFPKAPPMLVAPDGREVGYRTRQSELTTKGRYWSIKDMPDQLMPLWQQITLHRAKSTHLTRAKRPVTVKRPWTKPATVVMNLRYLTRYMSYLCLPTSEKPEYEMTLEDHWKAGKGFSPDQLTFQQWFDVDLLHQYIEWRKRRTWNGQVTGEVCDLIATITVLCKHEISFVNKHPELHTHFGVDRMPEEEWDAWVRTNLAAPLLGYLKELRLARPDSLARAPEEALRHVLYAEDPMVLANQMLTSIKRTPVPRIRKQRHAIWLRDIAVISVLLECPLRARNLCELKIGSTIIQKDGVWWFDIPKTSLKNHRAPDAQAIYRPLSASASEAVQVYVDHRSALDPSGDKTALFLVQPKSGSKKKTAADGALTQTALERLVTKWLSKSFGRGAGPHFFRHLIATAILRADPRAVDAAAAVLNISEEVVKERYAHLLQKDGLARGTNFLDRKRIEAEVRASLPRASGGLQ